MVTETSAPLISQTDLTDDIQIFEYSQAANPIESGSTPRIPIRSFSPELYSRGKTRIIPLDLSSELRTPFPATGPSLLAHFILIQANDSVQTTPVASSEFYYVIRGNGHTDTAQGSITWSAGDFLVLPGIEASHHADSDSAFYMVNDSPLFSYLGARQAEAKFRPTLYSRETVFKELEAARKDPEASKRSRISVLLANQRFAQTMTITHTLWTMFGTIGPRSRQLPHRHQSVALDYVVDAKPGVYTLVGAELKEDGTILDPVRVDWIQGSAFVTPPGLWHEHVNESDSEAYVMPIQDAGLHTYLRTLDIQFYLED